MPLGDNVQVELLASGTVQFPIVNSGTSLTIGLHWPLRCRVSTVAGVNNPIFQYLIVCPLNQFHMMIEGFCSVSHRLVVPLDVLG